MPNGRHEGAGPPWTTEHPPDERGDLLLKGEKSMNAPTRPRITRTKILAGAGAAVLALTATVATPATAAIETDAVVGGVDADFLWARAGACRLYAHDGVFGVVPGRDGWDRCMAYRVDDRSR